MTRAGSPRAPQQVDSRLGLVLDALRDYAIARLDTQGRVMTWSAGGEQILGYAAAEVVGAHLSRFYQPEDVAAGRPEYDLALVERAGRSEDEGWRLRKDGSRFWAEVVITPVRDERSRLVGYVAVTRDLTEQKRARDALRASAARLAGVVGSAMDAIIAVDSSQRITAFNRAAEQMFRCSAEAALGLPIDRFIPARFRARHAEHIRAFGRTGVTSRSMRSPGELVGLRADGEEFPIEATISQFETGGDKVFTVILRDITERKRAEAALRDSRAQLAGIIESAMDAIITVDETQRITVLNRATERMFRCSAADLLGQPLDRLIPPRFHVGHAEHVRSFGRTGVTSRAMGRPGPPLVALRTDGSEFPIEASISQVEVGGKKLFTVILRDITERERAEQEREELLARERAARAEAEAAVRAREAFLARASHELRTPLTSALGTVRLLGRALAGALRERPQELAQIADRNLSAMLALVNDLLDASKLASGQERLARETIEVREVVQRSADIVGGEAREKGIAIRLAVPPGLRLVADPAKLEQVLVNLLANAVKFTPPGGHVTVEAASEGRDVVLTVRDEGIGIAAEHLEAIFQPFYQAGRDGYRPSGDRRVQALRGTGLGLAICRQIVSLHGGTIHAESGGPGRGSSFVLRLPASPREA